MDTPATQGLHVAVIPDGNRRWAKKQALKSWDGHRRGIDVFEKILEAARDDERISVLTCWGFSAENWKRESAEVAAIMKLVEDFLRRERPKFAERQTRFVHAGRRDRLPKSLARLIQDIEVETCSYSQFTVQLALDYSGRDELLRAVAGVVDSGGAISEASLRDQLDQPHLPDIDLIIRTSGEQRLSNFFLWQGAYAELAFVETLFPEFTPESFAAIVDDFAERERRFGA